jgi:hypothetical protein
MKIKLCDLNPNPFKKEIHGGKLSKEQVDRIKSNIKELGLMGAFPVVKTNGEYFMVSGHHRHQALLETYGKNYEVECVIHNYDDDKMLRGMIVENLTQRNDDFKENVENLAAIRKWLQKNIINRSESEQMKSKRADGRGGRLDEAGSIRHISDWLNKNGEVMSVTAIQEHLSVFDKLDKELYNKVEKTHKGDTEKRTDENIISKSQAVLLARIEDKAEQKDLAKIMIAEKKKDNSEETGSAVRSQGKQLTAYKQADEELKQNVRSGKIELKDVPKLINVKQKDVINAVIKKDISAEQAERISRLKKIEDRARAIQEHKKIKEVEKRVEKDIVSSSSLKDKKEFDKRLMQVNNWIVSFRNSTTESRGKLEQTIKILLTATQFLNIMDDKQKKRLEIELERFIEILERGEQLSEQIKNKIK